MLVGVVSDDEKRVALSVEAALALLPEGEYVHVFSNPAAGALIGSDWSRASAEKRIASAELREIGGPACRGMGHGLVVWEKRGARRPLFFATREDVDWAEVETSKAGPR